MNLADLARAYERTYGSLLQHRTEDIAEWWGHTARLAPEIVPDGLLGATEEGFALAVKIQHALARWRGSGYPIFELTHGFMSGALLTDPSNVEPGDLRMPFSCFAARLPQPFWTTYSEGLKREVPVESVLFCRALYPIRDAGAKNDGLFVVALCSDGVELHELLRWPEGSSLGGWLALVQERHARLDAEGIDDHDARLLAAARRIFANLCLYVSERPPQREGRPPRGNGSAPLDLRPYVVSREVKLNRVLLDAARAWTDAAVLGRRAGWRIQRRHVVIGHWRRVPVGPREESRRAPRWIAPYPRGPQEGGLVQHLYATGS